MTAGSMPFPRRDRTGSPDVGMRERGRCGGRDAADEHLVREVWPPAVPVRVGHTC
jgi:hypothetical protein